MVCRFELDGHFREAIGRLLDVKSTSIYMCVGLSEPLDVDAAVVTRGDESFICVEGAVKLYLAFLCSFSLTNWRTEEKTTTIVTISNCYC